MAAEEPERETFANRIDFLLTCMGFSIGLGNVWRFPYLVYRNGGGAFLIPYFLAVIFAGIPLFLLESSLGQWMRVGPVKAWNIIPLFQGIGIATTMIVTYSNCYYNVIMAWCFFYLYHSFSAELPWSTCGNDWNTPLCTEEFNITQNVTLQDPTTEFWEHKALKISDGIEEMGVIHWQMMLCFLFAWMLVYFIIWKGIRTSGKVLYVTTPLPYIIMIILLIRGATLSGAGEGVDFFIVPDFDRLSDIDVWAEAVSQIFFSYSLSFGVHTAFGSYNEFHHNAYRDVLFFAGANTGTSLLSGMAIFCTLGFMAEQQGQTVDDVAESGPGLAFIAYPKAVTEMPVPQLWSVLFFLMFIMLGLNTQFLSVEGVITSIEDQFPKLRKSPYRELSIAGICTAQFIIGLSMMTEGGMYVFQLFDYYGTSRTGIIVGFLQCSVIAYIYGVNKYYDNIEIMYGFRLNIFMKICWLVITPLFTIVFFVISFFTYSELTYERPTTIYTYPGWAIWIGWAMAASSIMWVPIVAIYKIIKYKRQGKPLSDLLQPREGGHVDEIAKDNAKQDREDITNIVHVISTGDVTYDNETYRPDA